MSTHVFSDDAGNLTNATYFDGTDNPNPAAANPTGFAAPNDGDDQVPPADEGAMGIVGPVTGASGGNNPAEPGSATAPGQP